MKYLLDTNVLIDLLRGNDILHKHLQQVGIENCAIADVTLWELYYGAQKSAKPEQNMATIKQTLKDVQIIPLVDYVEIASKQKIALIKHGKTIEDFDILIGSAAIASDRILVSSNVKHLSRLVGIRIEDWSKSKNEG